jgi:hypothetical protein
MGTFFSSLPFAASWRGYEMPQPGIVEHVRVHLDYMAHQAEFKPLMAFVGDSTLCLSAPWHYSDRSSAGYVVMKEVEADTERPPFYEAYHAHFGPSSS